MSSTLRAPRQPGGHCHPINGKRTVTPETALRLARTTDTEPEFWLDLQQAVDLWDALHSAGALELLDIQPAHLP